MKIEAAPQLTRKPRKARGAKIPGIETPTGNAADIFATVLSVVGNAFSDQGAVTEDEKRMLANGLASIPQDKLSKVMETAGPAMIIMGVGSWAFRVATTRRKPAPPPAKDPPTNPHVTTTPPEAVDLTRNNPFVKPTDNKDLGALNGLERTTFNLG